VYFAALHIRSLLTRGNETLGVENRNKDCLVRLKFLTTVIVKVAVFWVVTPCSNESTRCRVTENKLWRSTLQVQ
jgi:hypothetical protein